MSIPAELADRLAALSPDKRALVLQRLQAGAARSADDAIPVASRQGRLPLSSAQRRLWMLAQLEGPSATYNVASALRLTGALNAAALARALRTLLTRHEALRTTFHTGADGFVEQHPVPVADLRWSLVTEAVDGTADEDALRRLAADARRPFTLTSEPPFRATLYRLAPDRHLLLLVLHHLVTDGWSMNILVEELGEAYSAALEDREPSLAALTIHYADYAAWESARQETAGLDYWVGTLQDATTSLGLPTDRPRASMATFRGDVVPFRLEASTMRRVRAVGETAGASPFAVCLAAVAVVLARWTGQDDIVLGCPCANRTARGTERLVGFFVNTLPVRVSHLGSPSFRDQIGRAHESIAGAIAHQSVPLERIVDALQVAREPGRSPLFQAVVAYQSSPPTIALPSLRVEPVRLQTGTAKFELTVILDDGVDGCDGTIEFNADLFDRGSIERLARHLCVFLDAALNRPHAPVDELDSMPSDERRILLEQWAGLRTTYPRDTSIPALLDRIAEDTPERIALVYGDESVSYGQLVARSRQVAGVLRARGVGLGDTVAICAERSSEMVVAIAGILRAGAAYLPIDPSYPSPRVAFMLDDAGADIVLTHGATPDLPARVYAIAVESAIASREDHDDAVGIAATDAAYVMYTSGSTGEPKGVRVPHRAVVRLVCGTTFVPVTASDVFLQLAPITFDASTFEIWAPLLNGACLAIAPPGRLSVQEIGDAIAGHRVTTLWLTASFFNVVVDERLETLAGIEHLLVGGDALSRSHVLRAARTLEGTTLINGYGPTENTTFTCCHAIDPTDDYPNGIPIGQPIANTTVYILDDGRRLAPIGVAGELYTGGDGLALGYERQAALTKERFVENPFGDGRLYRTGDRARWLNDGTIEFLGRRDQQVKVRGFRVEPGEVEAAILRVPGIRHAVVTVRRGATGHELAAYVVGADADSVSRALRTTLPEFMLPATVIELDAVPLTPHGKVDRAALPAPSPSAAHEWVAPATATEAQVTRLVSELLDVGRVSATDRFFDLGGNSLTATQLVARIRSASGVDVPLRAVFDTPDLRGLAAAVDALASPGADEAIAGDIIPRIARTAPLPLSFAQERLWFLQQLEPDNPFYNVAIALRLTGNLDVQALQLAIGDIVSRHEILRTRYVDVDGRPTQAIDPMVDLPLTLVTREEIRGELDVERRARDEARACFDLATGPVIRTTLLQVADDRFVLLVTMHHIAADGWSMGVLVNELSAGYAARSGSRLPAAAAPLPIQYADFAHWQRAAAERDAFQRQMQYWKQQLAGIPSELPLPTDRPRPPVQSFRGGSVTFTIDATHGEGVATLARELDATPFMVLLAAFATVLARRASQEDLVIGSPIANRTHAPLEPLIGFFVNTLALRIDLSGDPSFRDLVQRVRQMALDGYANQDVPFERLVHELQPERDLSRNPLFQVMFALQNAAVRRIELPGLRVEPLELERTTAQFDLVLDMWEREDGSLLGVLEFSADLFDHATVRRMVDELRTLVAAAVSTPSRPLSALPRLSDSERRLLLEDFNANRATFPVDRTIHELFEAMVADGPDRCAAEHRGGALRYDALNARANRLAHRLRGLTVGRNDFVAILLERGLDFLAAMLGTLKAGAAFVPVDPSYPADRVAFMLENSSARIAITRAALGHSVDGCPAVMVDDPSLAAESSENPGNLNTPGDRAYMLYTSGSTGVPKGAILRHDGKINHIYAQFRWLAFHRESTFLQTAPSSSDISVWQCLGPLLIGGRTVIVDYETVCEPAALWRAIRDSRATIIELVPVAMAALLEHVASRPAAERSSTSLEWAMATGEAVSPALVNRWLELFPSIPIVNAYGPTEAADDVCQHTATRPLPADARSVPIGTPLANLSMYVLDERLQLQPIGVPGEIAVSGIGVGEGYWHDEVRTRERFVPNPYAGGGRGETLYLTGDIGYWRADGVLECLSRTDGQIKVRGFRIELGEVEATLGAHPAVRDAAVIAHGASDDRRLAAYIVPNATSPDVSGEIALMREEQIALWKDLHEDEYRQTLDYGDPTFNVIGWDSSYTGDPLPREEMREYVDNTVGRIAGLHPRRLLEIGCGSGLLMFHLVPRLEHYVGTDLSQVAIDRLEALRGDPAMRDRVPHLDRVRLLATRADALDEIAPGSIDTAIFPSVLQYFTGVDYLLTVLDRLITKIETPGAIFFGDVRSLSLLEPFHASVALFKADAETTAAELVDRIHARASQEQEMALDPAFFYALRDRHPAISDVQILPKRGASQNEMTRFRYDAIVRIGGGVSPRRPVSWTAWPEDLTVGVLTDRLRASADTLAFADVPNVRLARERALARCLTSRTRPTNSGAIRTALDGVGPHGVDPGELEALGEACGRDVHLSFARHTAEGRFDVAFVPRGSAPPQFPEPQTHRTWTRFANNPLHERLARVLTPRLRDHLKARLPHYMVPATITLLHALPTTPAGKIDRAALPPPRSSQLTAAEDLTPPVTDTERALADIWREVLAIDACGARQNFFDLGGHSLKATQVVSRIRQRFGVELPLRTLFAQPTIAELAQTIDETAGPSAPERIPHVPDAAHYLLSPAQRRLWILAQLDEGSIAYNMPTSLLVDGPLDVGRLERAFAAVVAHHEALRTTFLIVDDEPRQRVQAPGPIVVPVVDVSGANDPHAAAVELAHRDAVLPFNLERGPLVRLSVVRMAPERHVLLFNSHHIISDDWSTGVLIRDFMRAYDGIALAPLRLQQRDIAAWQADQLTRDGDRHRAYWLQRLSGSLPALDLPADHPRPAVKTYRGATTHLRLDARLCDALRGLARQQRSTLFMTLLAGVKALLFRYTGATDIIVASPVAGREHPDIENQIGFYVNTLALRDELAPTLSFAEVIAGVTRTTTEAIEHQSYPWDRLVGELAVRRDPSRMPVCDVTVVMANASQHTFALPRLAVREFLSDYRSSKYDLHVVFDEGADAIDVGFVYNPDLFSADRIERMAGHLQTLLRSAAAEPTRAIGRLALLKPTERDQVLRGFNPTASPRVEPPTLHGWFRDTALAQATRTAIVEADATRRTVSYADLDAASSRLAAALQSQGLQPGAFVGLFCDRSVDALIGMLGILKAGAAYVPIDAAYPSERASFILEDSGAALVLTTAALRDRLPPHRAVVLEIDDAVRTAASYTLVDSSPDDVAYVIYTSGSTGRPKGVMVTHANVCRLFTATDQWFAFAPTDVWSVFHSIAFDFSVWEIWGALLYGGCAVLVPHQTARSPQAFADLLAREGVTILNQTPSAFRALIDEERHDGWQRTFALRQVIFGGEALDLPSLRPWFERRGDRAPRLVNMYGITETTVHVTYRPLSMADVDAGRSVIGQPIPDLALYLLDANGEPVPIGVPGEIHVGGAGVARGYWNRDELTAERFTTNPYGPGRLYKSGDLGRYSPDGDIEYLGRLDQQLKVRGFRIEPGEVEAALLAHADVRQALVTTRVSPGGEPQLVAFVVGDVDPSALKRHVQQRLPDYMVPAAIATLASLPLTAHGKIDRAALPDPFAGQRLAAEPPVGAEEATIAEVLASTFGIERIGATVNFFDAGADSLMLIKAHRALQTRLDRAFPLVTLYQHSTVRGLAGFIAGGETAADATADADRRAARRRDARAQAAVRRSGG